MRNAGQITIDPFSLRRGVFLRWWPADPLRCLQCVLFSEGVLVLLCACAGVPGQHAWIEVGRTTREEVVHAYGEPDLVMVSENGQTVLYRPMNPNRSAPRLEVPTAQPGPLGTTTTKMEPVAPSLGAAPLHGRLRERLDRELRIRYDAYGVVQELSR
jgi:hypothetical protein